MAKKSQGRIRIGVGGWTYAPWRGHFYPESLPQKSELQYASRHLTAIEINGTYYGSQKPATFAKWHDETPEDFAFSVKAPRYAMNRSVLAEAGPTITRFLNGGVLELKDKLGPINWQFLPTHAFEIADFAAFLALLPKEVDGRALRHAVEVRHDSFRCPEFVQLARDHEVAIVVAADSEYPQIADPTASFVYARIMGTQAKPSLGYSQEALNTWAERAQTWAGGKRAHGLQCVASNPAEGTPRDVYLYVISGHKVSNPATAMALIERVEAALPH
jgi:uncharacterized protein YecE (DUF72 family)